MVVPGHDTRPSPAGHRRSAARNRVARSPRSSTLTLASPCHRATSASSSANSAATWDAGCVELGLEPGRADDQFAPCAVGLEVDARDEPVTEKEGVDVVAVASLRLGDVDLDAVMQAVQTVRPVAFEDQRVEGAHECPRVDVPRHPRLVPDPPRPGPALDLDGPHLARGQPWSRWRPGRARSASGSSRPGSVRRTLPRARAARRARCSCAIGSSGVGVATTRRGSTLSGMS